MTLKLRSLYVKKCDKFLLQLVFCLVFTLKKLMCFRINIELFPMTNVKILFRNPKEPVELGNPNTRAKGKPCLFLFVLALETIFHKTKVFKQLVLAKAHLNPLTNFSQQIERDYNFWQ